MMPGMRGYELVERLRPLQPRARVLYMSGYVGEIEAAHEGKIIPLLSKPFKPRELLEEIRRVLDA
jgi:CheY-like chemotaxis protein